MKIVFISNYLTHHQIPFCDEMYRRTGRDFRFIETDTMPEERKKLGWHLEGMQRPYVMDIHASHEVRENAIEWINEADIAIIGGVEEKYIYNRIRENKTIFRYEERIFKKSWLMIMNPHVMHMLYKCHYKNRKKDMYVLCAGAYLPKEFKLLGLYKNKMLKWGYFPQTFLYDIKSLMDRKKHDTVEILWCARFIDWKHPEIVVETADSLRRNQAKFHITMIGDGILLSDTKSQIEEKGLQGYVSLTGAVPYTHVREYMETANIFLATSDRNEGWGAVINEAMNCGCTVVANQAMGAVPFLIKDGENGYMYRNTDECRKRLHELLQDSIKCSKMGECAYYTIVKDWNVATATENLLAFIRGNREKGDKPGLMI